MKILFFIILLSTFSCNSQIKYECLDKLELSLQPKNNLEIVEGEIIDIANSTKCFEWDELLIESSYGSKESIKKYYNVEIPYNYENSSNDEDAIIFFIKDKRAISHIKIKRNCSNKQTCKSYDFTSLIKYSPDAFIPKKNAIFEVYTKEIVDNRGKKWAMKNAIRLKIS